MTQRIGCYSTARVTRGRIERVERHVFRLQRDALRLGLPKPATREIESVLWESAAAAFPEQDGIVRVDWSRSSDSGTAQLSTTTRSLGLDPPTWRACSAKTTHPGAEQRQNTKATGIEAIEAARVEMREAGVDEMLLYDTDGWLVEGGHSNCLLVDATGQLATPALSLGGVEGLGLTIFKESGLPIREGRFARAELLAASEVLGINCVRGVVPIVELDGQSIGSGVPGVWAQRLAKWFQSN